MFNSTYILKAHYLLNILGLVWPRGLHSTKKKKKFMKLSKLNFFRKDIKIGFISLFTEILIKNCTLILIEIENKWAIRKQFVASLINTFNDSFECLHVFSSEFFWCWIIIFFFLAIVVWIELFRPLSETLFTNKSILILLLFGFWCIMIECRFVYGCKIKSKFILKLSKVKQLCKISVGFKFWARL